MFDLNREQMGLCKWPKKRKRSRKGTNRYFAVRAGLEEESTSVAVSPVQDTRRSPPSHYLPRHARAVVRLSAILSRSSGSHCNAWGSFRLTPG